MDKSVSIKKKDKLHSAMYASFGRYAKTYYYGPSAHLSLILPAFYSSKSAVTCFQLVP